MMGKNAQERIHEYLKFGSKLGLERMEALLARLGNPEKELRVIHVAGTNGKGSVCRYIYESLRALGYSAGIFTSPYVGDFRERIEMNGEMISEERLGALADRAIEAAEELAAAGDTPTEFEIVTAIGLMYFAEANPDFTVLEVGLGGRGDSTNIVKQPLAAIITGIALDHTDRLGDTVEKIAWEKAGVIKPCCPVVSGATGAARAVIAKRCYELSAPLTDASRIEYRITKRNAHGYVFDTVIGGRRYDGVELSMAGEHQVQNAVTALCALDILRAGKHILMDGEALRRGMKRARLDARFFVTGEAPFVIFDGAHNPDGARALVKTLRELLPEKHILFVISILRDKAALEMLEEFSCVADAFVATASSNERSLPADELAAQIRASGGRVIREDASPEDAYRSAMAVSGEYDAVVFAGSLYMIGDIRRAVTSENEMVREE